MGEDGVPQIGVMEVRTAGICTEEIHGDKALTSQGGS